MMHVIYIVRPLQISLKVGYTMNSRFRKRKTFFFKGKIKVRYRSIPVKLLIGDVFML